MAERRAARRGLHTIRVRATVGAVVVVAVALVVAGVVQVRVVRGHLVDAAEATAESAAIGVAEQARTGTLPEVLAVADDDTRFLQVLDARGQVVAASENVETRGPIVPLSPERDDDDEDDDEDDGESVEYDAEAATFGDVAVEDGGRWRVVALEADSPDGSLTVLSGVALEEVDETLATIRRSLLLGVPVLLLVVGLVVLVVIRRSLRPVDRMRADLEDISSRELHRRVTVPDHDDELRRLADAMNGLLDRVQASSERQRRFIADASHELRSPIAAARAQLDVALAHPDATDWPATAASSLHDIQRVETLAADLLTLAQLDAAVGPTTSTVDLGELVAEVLSSRVRSSRAVRAHLAPDVVVDGDPGQLARVVRNLVDNAERHAATSVDVTVRSEGSVAVVEVADDGPGIAPADRERVFERFTRLDDARARDAGGAGLGLAIVREVVRAHGGDVEIAGPPGAILRARLPARTAAAP